VLGNCFRSPELEISESTDELIGVGSSMQVEIGSDNKMKTNCSADGISTKVISVYACHHSPLLLYFKVIFIYGVSSS